MKEAKPDTPRYSPTKYHYLRRTYRGYQWHQFTSSSINPNRFSLAPAAAHASFALHTLPRDLVTQRRDGAAETLRSSSSQTTYGTVGYLSLASFAYLQRVLREEGREGLVLRVSRALYHLATSSRSPVTTLVIDMRSAHLYQMDIMLELLAPFLPNTLAARTINGHNKEFRYATPSPEYRYTGAVIILVNDETKKHAELFAATLQERGRALIVGEGLGRATAGEGIQNRVLSLPKNIAMPEKFSHRLFLSHNYLYTPGGRVIEGRGVTPDISLPLAVDLPVPNSTPERIRRFYQDNPIPKPLANNFNDIRCFAPRTPSRTKLIHRLRDRAYERMLARTYPQLKLSPKGDSDQELEVIQASFEETFSLSAVRLRGQSPPPCLHTMCGKVGLLKKDYLRHQQINNYRAQRLEATEDLLANRAVHLWYFAQEDPALWETLHIALDYKAHHEKLPYSQKHFSLQAPPVK